MLLKIELNIVAQWKNAIRFPVLVTILPLYTATFPLIELWNEVSDALTTSPSQIYNTTNGHVKLLMIRAREESVTSWAAGEFIDYQTILVWDKVHTPSFYRPIYLFGTVTHCTIL